MKKIKCYKCESTFWAKEDDIFQHGFETTLGKTRKLRGASCPYCRAVNKVCVPYFISCNYAKNIDQTVEDKDILIKQREIVSHFYKGTHYWPQCMGLEMDLIRIFKEAVKDDPKRKYRTL